MRACVCHFFVVSLQRKTERRMKELKCPHCGNVFTVDESDYAALLVSKVEIYDKTERL